MTTSFSLKQRETRTSSGPIPHPLKVSYMFSLLKSNSCRWGGGERGERLYNHDQNSHPPLNFPGQRQNQFFILIGPCPLSNHYQWTPVKSVAYSYWMWRPGQDVKVALTERVARPITGGVQGLALGPVVGYRVGWSLQKLSGFSILECLWGALRYLIILKQMN